jgi:tRNA A-37 threonylcarbamoyl transferase component Bud32
MRKKLISVLGHVGGDMYSTTFRVNKKEIKKIIGGVIEDCQSKFDSQAEFVILSKVLQNIENKNIATLVGKVEGSDVVLKVQQIKAAQKEYSIQQKLSELDYIIKYECMFACNSVDNPSYVKDFGLSEPLTTKICKDRGNNTGVIIMKYINGGSFDYYLKNNKNEKSLNIICKVIENYFNAYDKLGFIHGDFYPKNIMINEKEEPIIIDFEMSDFSKDPSLFWRDLSGFLDSVGSFRYWSELDIIVRNHIIIARAYNRIPTIELINELCTAIRNLDA